ncbi:hypothetical protein [Escherichia coli]|uniref:hypothetical protein n=1 Tax=Escherichia coli TaxID=562 RepID=UPI00191A56DE|nr:hypothetical protein [Escherichia coli]CAD6182531.1 hypothetical protein QREC_QR363_04473 [Escherichia coli]
MYYQNQSYLNRVGNNYKPSQETLDKRSFDKAMSAEADRIVDMLPSLLAKVIDESAAELFEQMPECMRGEDPVTHDVLNETHIRMMLAGKVANRIGHGMSFLQK